MYQRDTLKNPGNGKFSSLKYLRKPQRIVSQIESTAMHDALKRNTDLNKSNAVSERIGGEGVDVEEELSQEFETTMDFNDSEGTDPLAKEPWQGTAETSSVMRDYFPIVEPRQDEVTKRYGCIGEVKSDYTYKNGGGDGGGDGAGDSGEGTEGTETGEDEDEGGGSSFKPTSILLQRSKSLPTSPFEATKDSLERPAVFKRSKSVHFAQSEKFEVKYFREDESPVFLRNESGEFKGKLNQLRKSQRHRRRDTKGSKSRVLRLVNGNLQLRIQTPTLMKLDLFGMISNHFATKAASEGTNGKCKNTVGTAGQPPSNDTNETRNRSPGASWGFGQASSAAPSSPTPVPASGDASSASSASSAFICHLQDLRLDLQGNMLVGNIFVRNISYEKRVIVRYTLNKWRTQQDIESVWVSHDKDIKIAGGSIDIDVFQFAIDLGDIDSAEHIELCILYQTRQGQCWTDHWDNNQGVNYKVSIEAAT